MRHQTARQQSKVLVELFQKLAEWRDSVSPRPPQRSKSSLRRFFFVSFFLCGCFSQRKKRQTITGKQPLSRALAHLTTLRCFALQNSTRSSLTQGSLYKNLLILRFAPLHELAFVPGEGGTRSVTATFAQQTCLLRSKKDEVSFQKLLCAKEPHQSRHKP